MGLVMKSEKLLKLFILFFSLVNSLYAINQDSLYFAQNYNKQEVRIPMRDGITLFTSIYSPKDLTEKYPIILWRTPYSCAPYGKNKYLSNRLNSIFHFVKEKYIIVYQDVRGKFMSEGNFVNMRPFIPNKISNKDVDESSDAYDTIEWLINNVENNNGNVGIWGISYPGFYASMSTIDAHPALKAVSPQAPIADWFIGDDMHHNGAFSLLLNFNFFNVFGLKRDSLSTTWPKGLDYASPDAYNFFLKLGSLKNVNVNYFKNTIAFWDSSIAHPNYDYYWQNRNILNHLTNIKPAILTVGGWYDGEDLFGALNTYQTIEKNNSNLNLLVMGPWPHGGWSRADGDVFGDMNFQNKTGEFFRTNIELPFFNYFLKNKGEFNLPEAFVFETGNNVWHKFDQYPPKNATSRNLFFYPNAELKFVEPEDSILSFDEFISDPNKPIPYTSKFIDSKSFYYREFKVEDQRFASSRTDVLSYETKVLNDELTIIGPLEAELYVSTSGTDSDWIVKIIDVFPDDAFNPRPNPKNIEMGGYQMLVRAEILRGRYRNSYEYPEPFVPNEITKLKINLNDICHTFLKGHKIMVQIQSSWFPLFDRNPQTFVDIYNADEKDFKKAINRVYFGKDYQSKIIFTELNK